MSTLNIAEQVLNAWGASVVPISTSSEEESDWLATLGEHRFLIEEKLKYENPEARARRQAKLAAGELAPSTTPIAPNNRLSGIVGKAVNQIQSSSSKIEHDFRLIWLTAVGRDAEPRHLQFMATLYGSTQIFELNKGGLMPCYFFKNSDFFRYGAQIDGAVAAFLMGSSVTLKLCLNPYSSAWQALRDSSLARKFPHGLVDPVSEEAAGEAYIADTDVNRKNGQAVLDYLQSKYKTGPLDNMDMGFTSISLSMER